MEGVRFIDSFRFKLISIIVIFILFPIVIYSIIYSNLVKNIIVKKIQRIGHSIGKRSREEY